VKNIGNDTEFPIPTDFISASYPMNGQFAFDLSESIPHTGYIKFGNGSFTKLYELYGKNYQLRARWVSSKNEVTYTLASNVFLSDVLSFFFDLPDTLLPGYVYKLELIALPEGYVRPSIPAQDCWNEFRGKSDESSVLNKNTFPGEIRSRNCISGPVHILTGKSWKACMVLWTGKKEPSLLRQTSLLILLK
jgi:hypothetical protein